MPDVNKGDLENMQLVEDTELSWRIQNQAWEKDKFKQYCQFVKSKKGVGEDRKCEVLQEFKGFTPKKAVKLIKAWDNLISFYFEV